MAKGMKGYEDQKDGGYTKPEYAAEGKTVIPHGARGVLADGKVTTGERYPNRLAKGDGRTE